MRLARVGALVLGLASSGCPGGSRAKSEAAAVHRAVNSLRDADNEKKRVFLGELRALDCSVEDICAVRSACLAAYELHVRTLGRTHELATNAGDSGPPEAALEELKRDLLHARELTASCADAQGAMVRRYKL